MNEGLLFVGLIFVGLFLTIKVTTEGMRQVNEQKIKLAQFQSATEQCQSKLDREMEDVQALEDQVKQRDQDYKNLADKEKSLATLVSDLEKKAPTRTRVKK